MRSSGQHQTPLAPLRESRAEQSRAGLGSALRPSGTFSSGIKSEQRWPPMLYPEIWFWKMERRKFKLPPASPNFSETRGPCWYRGEKPLELVWLDRRLRLDCNLWVMWSTKAGLHSCKTRGTSDHLWGVFHGFISEKWDFTLVQRETSPCFLHAAEQLRQPVVTQL